MRWASLPSDSNGVRSHHFRCPLHKEVLCLLLAPNQTALIECEELLAQLTQIGCARCPQRPAGQPHGRHLCRFDFRRS